MTGSLQIKRDKYFVVLSYKDFHGQWKQKWVATGLDAKGNKRRAAEMLPQIVATYAEKEVYLGKEEILFSDFLKYWLEQKKGKLEVSTWEGYKTYTEKHIIPYFAEQKLTLTQLAPRHFVAYYDHEFRRGRVDGAGGMSIRSIKSYSLIIKEALNTAVIMEYIGRNPALNVPLPKQEEKTQVGVFLNAEEANRMLKAFREHHLQPLVYVTLYYGLRRSEVLGLKWDAVNFEKNTIEIKHTVVKNLTVVAKDKTKTAASKRSYPLLPEVRELLLRVKDEQQKFAGWYGAAYRKSDYIFTWPDGKPYAPDYITRGFQRVLKNNGLPKMRFHDIRHSTASILYDQGWSLKDIQDWLGHADLETTGNIYTHISKLRKQKMAGDITNLFHL